MIASGGLSGSGRSAVAALVARGRPGFAWWSASTCFAGRRRRRGRTAASALARPADAYDRASAREVERALGARESVDRGRDVPARARSARRLARVGATGYGRRRRLRRVRRGRGWSVKLAASRRAMRRRVLGTRAGTRTCGQRARRRQPLAPTSRSSVADTAATHLADVRRALRAAACGAGGRAGRIVHRIPSAQRVVTRSRAEARPA